MSKCGMMGLAFGLAIAMCGAPALAGWTLLDDFDSYDNTDTHTTIATGGVWTSEFDGTNNSHIVDVDPSHAQALQSKGGAPWRGAKRDLSGTGAAVLVGEVQTYFWQVMADVSQSPSGGYDFMMGLSPDVSNIDTNNAYQDFNVMPFVNNAADTPFINAQAPTTPWWAPMTQAVWTNVWVVIDNNATAPTYDLYYSTGSDAPVLVADNADWRNTGALPINQDLNAIGFMAAGAEFTELYIDNIYYADGEDLSNPVPEPASLALLAVGGVTLLRRRR